MASKILFHGTSAENYKAIREFGFNSGFLWGNTCTTWNCSDEDMVYCWDRDALNILRDIETDSDNIDCAAIESAFDNAQITAAVNSSIGNCLYVFKLEIDESLINPDDSCDNMEGAVQVIASDITPDCIKSVYVTKYNPHFALFYIAGIDRLFLNANLDSDELNMCDKIAASELFIDFDGFDYYEIGV